MGHAYANYFGKAYIVSYKKMPKQNKLTVFFFLQNPVKVKKYLKKINNFKPVPATSRALFFIRNSVVSFVYERIIEFLPCDCHFLFESQSV